MTASRSKWLAGFAALLVVVIGAGAWLSGEPLRRYVERRVNERARGFSVSIGALHLNLLLGSVQVRDVVVIQDAHPEPPVVKVAFASATLQFSALLRGRLAGRVTLDHPAVYVDRPRLEHARDQNKPKEKGRWQRSVKRVHPFRITELTVHEGAFTFIDGKRHRPLAFTAINGTAHDIESHRDDDVEYPSPVRAEGIVFGDGHLTFDGHVDFLRPPHPAAKGTLTAENVALDYFAPSAAKHHVALLAGTVTGTGELEYSPTIRRLAADTARIDGGRADFRYRKSAPPAPPRKKGKPPWIMIARTLRIRDANVGFVNEDARPDYRVFLSQADVDVTNFTTRDIDGVMEGKLNALFMGNASASATARVRPDPHGVNLDVRAAIEDLDLRKLNDVFRAHARLDVASGMLSAYADARIRDGWIKGWVQPVFRQLKAYDPEQDRDRPLGEKLRKRLVDLANKIFGDAEHGEVTTRASIERQLPDARANTLQALGYVVQSAFSRAVIPRFGKPLNAIPGAKPGERR